MTPSTTTRRPRSARRLAFAVAALTAITATGFAPATAQTVVGQLLDDATGQPITAATVRLLDRYQAVVRTGVTGSHGEFQLGAPRVGRYQVRAEALGYHSALFPPLDLLDDEAVEIELRLAVDAVPIEPLRVVGERAALVLDARLDGWGFYERRSMWRPLGAHHLDQAEIRSRHHSSLVEVLRGLPDIRVGSLGGAVGPHGSRTIITDRMGRQLTVCLDGANFRTNYGSLDELVPLSTILGVEVYATSTVRGNALCDVMIWTGIASTEGGRP